MNRKQRTKHDIETELINAKTELEKIKTDPDEEIEDLLLNLSHNTTDKDENENIKRQQQEHIVSKQMYLIQRIAELEKERLESLTTNTITLRINLSTGEVTFGNKHYTFGTNLNPFRLLSFLARNPKKLFTANELHPALRKARAGGEFSSEDRRIRDTIQTIRKSLGLANDKLFIVEKGSFGLKCDIELVG